MRLGSPSQRPVCSEEVQTVIVVPGWASLFRRADHRPHRSDRRRLRGLHLPNPSACSSPRGKSVSVDITPIGFRTDETGRVEEVEMVRVVQTYWIRSDEGRSYSVSAVKVAQQAKVCP